MSLDLRAAFGAPMLAGVDGDLESARHITYRVEQRFRYEYDAPVTQLSQRLVFVPRSRHGDLCRLGHRVRVSGVSARPRSRLDAAGNTITRVVADRVEHAVEFEVVAILQRVRRPGDRHVVAARSTLRRPTPLTAPDERLRAMAADLARAGGRPRELAERICVAVHQALPYEYGVTGVATTAAEALAAGRGVCQDAAHIMLALCHLVGLPARYVSGHLLGQGGTHAWVEVLLAQRDATIAVPFDPCYGRGTNHRYVTVAVGRDYHDVAPTTGSYVGAPGGRLVAERRVGVLAVDTAGPSRWRGGPHASRVTRTSTPNSSAGGPE